MILLGWLLALAGVIAVGAAFGLPSAPPGQATVNLDYLFAKVVFAVAGSGLGMAGAVFLAGADIRNEVRRLRQATERAAPVPVRSMPSESRMSDTTDDKRRERVAAAARAEAAKVDPDFRV